MSLRDLDQRRRTAAAGLRLTLASELESPLSAALGYADLVLESVASSDERRRVEGIRRHGHELLALVREIAASERAQSVPGQNLIEANPRATIELVVEDFRSVCDARGLRLWSDMRPALPGSGRFDSLRLRHGLRLVLESSLAHTQAGGISVRAGWRAPDRGEIEVIDTSPGPTLKEFERLARALDCGAEGLDDSTADGIGIALARRIARVLGGDLEYERAPNARGVYRLRFTLEPVASEQPSRGRGWLSLPELRLSGRVLLADPCEETRCLLRRVLEETGLEVATAETGRGAVDAALHGSFDLVLLALGMPVMDGFGAVAALRHVGCTAPVIALAAPEEGVLRERSRGFGFDAFLLKPIDRMTLLELIARHVPGRLARKGGGTA